MTTNEYRIKIMRELLHHLGKYTNDEWTAYYKEKCKDMLSFMEQKNKNADIWESAKNKKAHQHFWEVLVGNTLLEKGYNPQRDKRNAAPDYFFVKDGIKIHVEAKAPTEGVDEKLKPQTIPILKLEDMKYGASFEDGYIEGTNSILRFASTLSYVDKQIKEKFYKHNTVSKEDKIVIAINGSEATNGIEMDKRDFNAGCLSYGYNMYCALYGLDGNEYYSYKHQTFLQSIAPIIKRQSLVYSRFFNHGNDTPIDGVIYSNVNMKNYFSANNPCLFFPNPNKEDISKYFPFCKKINPPNYCR